MENNSTINFDGKEPLEVWTEFAELLDADNSQSRDLQTTLDYMKKQPKYGQMLFHNYGWLKEQGMKLDLGEFKYNICGWRLTSEDEDTIDYILHNESDEQALYTFIKVTVSVKQGLEYLLNHKEAFSLIMNDSELRHCLFSRGITKYLSQIKELARYDDSQLFKLLFDNNPSNKAIPYIEWFLNHTEMTFNLTDMLVSVLGEWADFLWRSVPGWPSRNGEKFPGESSDHYLRMLKGILKLDDMEYGGLTHVDWRNKKVLSCVNRLFEQASVEYYLESTPTRDLMKKLVEAWGNTKIS